MTPRAEAAVSGLQGELANQLRLTGEIWEEVGSSIAEPWNSPAWGRREPTFSLHVIYTTWNYICTIFYFLLFGPFWFEFSVICSQRQDDKCEPRIKPTFIVGVHLCSALFTEGCVHCLSAPVDSTQQEAGVRKAETWHRQGKDRFKRAERREGACWIGRDKLPSSPQGGVGSCEMCNPPLCYLKMWGK